MNTLTFPEGITYKYRYTTGGDFIPSEHNVGDSMSYAYTYCNNNIIKISYNTSSVTAMNSMFDHCGSLITIPLFDTSNVTNMSYMFEYCGSLITIPLFDTSNVTNMSYMFQYCSKLAYIPQLDTSNVANMNSMFYYCSKLAYIPQLDTSNVTNMSNMFYNCSNLNYIPQLDTSNVANMNSMFSSCFKLTSIPQLDCSKVTDIGLFGYSGNSSIVNLGGFKNLGMQKSVSNTTGNYFLGAASKLTHESIINVINNLYDRASAGYSVLKLKLHANTLALLSDEEKAIATNKGWTLS